MTESFAWGDGILGSPGKELAKLNPAQRLAILESVLFMASGSLKADDIEEAFGWPAALAEQDLLALADTYQNRGIELRRSGGAWRLTTAALCGPWVERFLRSESRRKLSKSQLETLAVIAYRQPVTRAEIENCRGVRSDRALSQLEDLNLIKSMGRSSLPGHPIEYGTTVDFLRYFGINSLKELPEISLEAELFRRINPESAEKKASESKKEAVYEETEAQETAVDPEIELSLNSPSTGLKRILQKIKKRRLSEEKGGGRES